jgi:uroporphyrinogen decarboxylase
MLNKAYPRHAIAARAVNSYGPFEQAANLRGREAFYMDLVAEPKLAKLLLQKCTDVIIHANEAFLEALGNSIDFFEIPGDDYGSSQDLIVSPAIFVETIKPELARIVRSIKDLRRDLPVAFHSDGAIQKIIGDLADIGIDILNPLEPLPVVDWGKIKKDFGSRLCFMGGVDIRQALRGSVKEVERDVRRCIHTFASGGGYLLTAANHLQMDIPPENILAMFDAAHTLGRYPLDHIS